MTLDVRYTYRTCPENGCLMVADTEMDRQVCDECGKHISNEEFDTPLWVEGEDPLA